MVAAKAAFSVVLLCSIHVTEVIDGSYGPVYHVQIEAPVQPAQANRNTGPARCGLAPHERRQKAR